MRILLTLMIYFLIIFYCIAVLYIPDKIISTYYDEVTGTFDDNFAYAHLNVSGSSPLQQVISQKDNIKILFGYVPEKPIIDTFTELKFSLINLTTNEHVKDFTARVVVTNGQRLFKFENITIPDGDFSVKYLFPDDGTHQVITRINKDTPIQLLASFNVFVPHQAPPSLLNPFPNALTNEIEFITRILIVLISFSVIGVVIVILRRGKRKKGKREKLGY
jgi:hypothetical protein